MKRNKLLKILFIIILITVILVIFVLIFFLVNKNFKIEKDNQNLSIKREEQVLRPKIVRESSIEHDFAEVRMFDVVVDKDIDKEQLTHISERLIGQIHKKEPDVDLIHLIFFSNKDLIETDPFDVGEVIWSLDRTKELTPEIAEKNIRDDYQIYVTMRSEIGYDLKKIPLENKTN